MLADGSYLSTIYPSEKDRRHRTRGIRCAWSSIGSESIAEAEPLYRLVTTIVDPAEAPAAELAALYHERWEIEGALAELKTHLRGTRMVLRSKTPELVRQEFWACAVSPQPAGSFPSSRRQAERSLASRLLEPADCASGQGQGSLMWIPTEGPVSAAFRPISSGVGLRSPVRYASSAAQRAGDVLARVPPVVSGQ